MTTAQVALGWLLARDDIIAIPKTASKARLAENLGALTCPLEVGVLAALDRIFPPPRASGALEML